MPRSHSIASAIVLGGITAGVLDILDAILFYRFHGTSAIRVLQTIASGLLGFHAYLGGLHTAMLGLALHFFIAFTCAAVFVIAAQSIPFLTRHPLRSGLWFGAIIYLVMNYIVLPHSRVLVHPRQTPAVLANGILAVLLLVGLPISLITRRFAYPSK
ncbi:MAG TPA: hypothetical protein VFE38_14505 [Edaphobacter sp.]|nr:hypothetical protein [Edaphobacter sp.]